MLPEWAGTKQIGRCRILYGGFDPQWAAGQLEREVVDQLATYISDKYPEQSTAIVVPNWYEYQAVQDWINQIPATVIACSLTDPLSQVWSTDTRIFGYGNIKFDFWAVACLRNFKQYRYQELLPTQFDFLFLNYNRKPHTHRIELVEAFEQAGIINLGCTTLGGSSYTVNDVDADYLNSGARDVVGDIGIPNDIYSLGRLDIWQRSFINIVSETQFDSTSTFVSEKTFKPIIGLRPFVINGNPQIYTWLQSAGFDCFEDIFPVQQLIRSTNTAHSHKLIVDAVQSIKDKDPMKVYLHLLPRLINNQTHFYEYANSQQNIPYNLDAIL
jgi:hypothetical protein